MSLENKMTFNVKFSCCCCFSYSVCSYGLDLSGVFRHGVFDVKSMLILCERPLLLYPGPYSGFHRFVVQIPA